jgi:chromosomal replication initiator protein
VKNRLVGPETSVVISSLFVISWSGREPLGLTRKTQAPALLLHEFIGDADNGLIRLLGESSELRSVPANAEFAHAGPVVLYGPTGSGKTHLSWLLAANLGSDSPSHRGCWITGADFVKQVSTAIEADAVADLRQRLRSAAAIFIDGLERITTRASAQDELRWLLEDCRQRSIPVVVTANSLPLEVSELCPQIASRLHEGLVVPLGPPGAAARQQLVRELLAKAGVDLPQRLASRLLQRLVPEGAASHGDDASPSFAHPSFSPIGERQRRRPSAAISPTVPALQEMVAELAKVYLIQQFTSARGRAVDSTDPAELTHQALQCVATFVDKWSRQNSVSLKQVSQAVAEYFGIRPVELKGPSRRQMVLRARGVAIYLGRHLAGESLDRLGAHFGGRDHSTALHAVRKTEELLAEDPQLRKAVDDLEKRLRSDGES